MSKVINWIFFIVAGYFFLDFISTPDVDRYNIGEIIEEGELDVFALRVGDCFDDNTGAINTNEVRELESVGAFPCNEPHYYEIFHALYYTQTEIFPGNDVLGQFAQDMCEQSFEAYIGIPYLESIFYISYFMPTLESWDNTGDREILCLIYDDSGNKITGSMKNSRI